MASRDVANFPVKSAVGKPVNKVEGRGVDLMHHDHMTQHKIKTFCRKSYGPYTVSIFLVRSHGYQSFGPYLQTPKPLFPSQIWMSVRRPTVAVRLCAATPLAASTASVHSARCTGRTARPAKVSAVTRWCHLSPHTGPRSICEYKPAVSLKGIVHPNCKITYRFPHPVSSL